MDNSLLSKLIILCLWHATFLHHTIIASSSNTQWPIITRTSKNSFPEELQKEAANAKLSILQPLPDDLLKLYQSYPNGSVLFPDHPDIALKFNTMIEGIKKNPQVIEFFRKIHINALNKIYEHCMKIYVNFNLTNPGCDQTTQEPTANVPAYLTDQAIYTTNKKKLLMNHFINIIQAQFGASIVSYVKTTPPDMAVAIGTLFITNDNGINLEQFTQPQSDKAIIAQQNTYLEILQNYIIFFQAYTNLLTQENSIGINQYYLAAKKIASLPALSSMNPAMFFYDSQSMRSIQFIPFIAGTIPAKSKLIPWAESIVNAAEKNTLQNGHPIAYFKDAVGKKTAEKNKAQSLFLLTEVGSSLFEQELLSQPTWLNNQNGCIRVLQGCLGDPSALVGLGILDATLEQIIQKALDQKTQKSSDIRREKKK